MDDGDGDGVAGELFPPLSAAVGLIWRLGIAAVSEGLLRREALQTACQGRFGNMRGTPRLSSARRTSLTTSFQQEALRMVSSHRSDPIHLPIPE